MASNLSMRLFGLPYQFTDSVDPRVSKISKNIGKKFFQNIMLEAPVCTIIPGEPSYLPGASDYTKASVASAILGGSDEFANFSDAMKITDENDLRLYDFKNNYTEYMKYVNILCRSGAIFLELDQSVTKLGNLTKYDWKNYRWESSSNVSFNVNNLFSGSDSTEGSISDVLKNRNYVQFYIDPDVSPTDTISNQTGESSLTSILDQGSSTMKEIMFLANSGGIDTEALTSFTEGSAAALQATVNEILGGTDIGGAIGRVINLGSGVLSGHNIIAPSIFQNSSYTKSYNITVHLKTPYGNKLGYFLDIFVPMMHLMALAMPRQESSNTFSSPFLVKASVDGLFSCNLGIVENISISKVSDSWSVEGLPTEVDVTLSIVDLYSDLTMTPSSAPVRFGQNTSLIEYLATNCGISLTSPNIQKKVDLIYSNVTSSFRDIPSTIKSVVNESLMSSINDFFSLY